MTDESEEEQPPLYLSESQRVILSVKHFFTYLAWMFEHEGKEEKPKKKALEFTDPRIAKAREEFMESMQEDE